MSIVNPGTWDDWQGGNDSSDSSPPYVISQSPPSGAMGVPKSNRLLSFHVADSGTGINSSDISATIAGATYTCSSGLSCTGTPNDITVTYVNESDWTENQVVAVSIHARDIAGNVMPAVSYTFSIGSWALAWSDEFDDAACTTQNPCAPDLTKWIYEVNHVTYDEKMATDNNHYYKSRSGVGWTGGWATDRKENVRVEAGTLVIEVRNDNYQGHGVTTGRLRTAGGYSDILQDPWVVKKQWKYGRLEARIKYDQSLGTWPAFWTGGVGPDIWPESGEIDILETYGFQPRVVQGGAWAKGADGSDHSVEYHYTMPDDPGTNWHTYSVEVSPGKLDYSIDFQLVRTVTSFELTVWPYDTYPQDIRIWYEFATMGGQGTNPSALPKRMTVDYVRYYTQEGITLTVSGLSPSFATAGGPAFTLTVNGSNFLSGAKVRWNGSDRTTTFVSATQLRANILAADVATAGTVPVTVFNPDGSLSNATTFEIRNPQPAVVHLTPSWGIAGGPSFTLIVDGSNFVSGSKVRWKGSDRATSFMSGTELQASISAADIAGAGTAGVTVYTPPPGGGTSNAINFDILPVLASLTVNPSSVVGGSPSTGTVTLTGPAPAGGALVSLSSDNTLAATVPSSVTVAAGATSATFAVTTSPVSGSTAVTISAVYGGVTRTASLTVTPVAAGLSSLTVNPSSVVGGSPSTGTVTLTGPAPVGGAVVSLSQRQHVGGHGSVERDGGGRRYQRHVRGHHIVCVRFHGRDDLGGVWRGHPDGSPDGHAGGGGVEFADGEPVQRGGWESFHGDGDADAVPRPSVERWCR